MARNNHAAADMLEAALSEFARSGSVSAREPVAVAPSYFTWPSRHDYADFRRQGFQLIAWREFMAFALACLRVRRADIMRG
jgi:hypothetical protein